MGASLFDSESESSFAADVRRIKENDRAAMRDEVDLSIRYFRRQQVADVEGELTTRFAATQAGGTGQDIQACVIPLTERFVVEQATLYNRPVRHWLSMPDGEETDATREQTKKLDDGYAACNHDEVMHAWEQMVCLLGVCALWPQIHNKRPRSVITLPHHVFPVARPPEEALEVDIADPDDYAAFVVETQHDKEDVGSTNARLYSYLSDKQIILYDGFGPNTPSKILGTAPQPLGMMPLVFWHRSLAVDQLLTCEDATIARANRELNVAWSVLMDTLKMQGYATPVKKLMNPDDPAAKQLHGVRFPVVLNVTEDYHYETTDAPFTQTVEVLREFVKLLALCERENPEDFSTNGAKALSGFSKAVSSLPKIEARQERAMRAKAVDEGPLWLRMREAMIRTGLLDQGVRELKYHVQYADIEFPQTPQEEAQALDSKFKWGLSSPAKELARRRGITVEEAQAEVDENKAAGGSQPPVAEPGLGLPPAAESGGLLAKLINGGRKKKAAPPQEETQGEEII